MNLSVDTIIRNRFLDPETARRVAAKSKNVDPFDCVSAGNLDAFLDEVKAAQGSELDNARIRRSQIDAYFGNRAVMR